MGALREVAYVGMAYQWVSLYTYTPALWQCCHPIDKTLGEGQAPSALYKVYITSPQLTGPVLWILRIVSSLYCLKSFGIRQDHCEYVQHPVPRNRMSITVTSKSCYNLRNIGICLTSSPLFMDQGASNLAGRSGTGASFGLTTLSVFPPAFQNQIPLFFQNFPASGLKRKRNMITKNNTF